MCFLSHHWRCYPSVQKADQQHPANCDIYVVRFRKVCRDCGKQKLDFEVMPGSYVRREMPKTLNAYLELEQK